MEFRRTFEGSSSTVGEIASTNPQKRKLPREEMPEHAADSCPLLDSQGSSMKSAFEKPPATDIPQKKIKTGAEGSTSATSILYLLFFLYFLTFFTLN